MTHAELVERAVKWLYGTGGCTVAFSEMTTLARESPDAIGFCGGASTSPSTLIECKVSRADFCRDKKKMPRLDGMEHHAMGHRRYYMAPAGVLKPEDVAGTKWGLLEVRGRHVRKVVEAEGFANRGYRYEVSFLVSMLRRIEIREHKMGEPPDALNRLIKKH